LNNLTLTITRKNGTVLLEPSRKRGTPETATFVNTLDTNFVVWFENHETFGLQAIRVDGRQEHQLRFLRPVVRTRYMLCEQQPVALKDTSGPDTIPGGGRDGDGSSEDN
jgi:hypothetical protein